MRRSRARPPAVRHAGSASAPSARAPASDGSRTPGSERRGSVGLAHAPVFGLAAPQVSYEYGGTVWEAIGNAIEDGANWIADHILIVALVVLLFALWSMYLGKRR